MPPEPACSVFLAFSQLLFGQEDYHQKEGACEPLGTGKAEEIPQGEPVMVGMFIIDSHLAYVLFDSGASHSFMSMGFA